MDNVTVLVADDNESVRRLLAETLGGLQTQILAAGDGFSAVQLARSARPDLVILDARMPVMDGFDVMKALREDRLTRSIPILMLTGLGESADQIKALECGADDYVVKPFNLNVLLARVSALLRRGHAQPVPA